MGAAGAIGVATPAALAAVLLALTALPLRIGLGWELAFGIAGRSGPAWGSASANGLFLAGASRKVEVSGMLLVPGSEATVDGAAVCGGEGAFCRVDIFQNPSIAK